MLYVAKAPSQLSASSTRLAADVRVLAASRPARAFHNVAALDKIADHIEKEFAVTGCHPVRQTFQIGESDYHNVICSFGPMSAPRVVIGAHYDVAGDDAPGADDNASGVAGVLELARMIAQAKPELHRRIDLVAFSLEEPPNFQTRNMGSYLYAEWLASEGIDVKLMISVEMIGYFSNAAGSQHYPLSVLKLFYPGIGDFIAVVGLVFDRRLVAHVKSLMQSGGALPVYSINAPRFISGVDFSDHWGFWQNDLPAVMVTDTAFLRNPNYHQPTDTPDTLDYARMAQVVDGLYRVAMGF